MERRRAGDRVCAALHDAEPVLGPVQGRGDLPAALVLTQRVMERVRARGLRPQSGAAPENWTGALPGMQGQHLDSERAALAFLCDALYMERHALVAEVIPKLELGRALALADALVIAETDVCREGMSIDRRLDAGRPPNPGAVVFRLPAPLLARDALGGHGEHERGLAGKPADVGEGRCPLKTNPPETPGDALIALDATHDKLAALLQLMHAQIIEPEEESVFGIDWQNGRLRLGLSLLCRDMVGELDARQLAVREAVKGQHQAKGGAR